jgi:hypothetical protein
MMGIICGTMNAKNVTHCARLAVIIMCASNAIAMLRRQIAPAMGSFLLTGKFVHSSVMSSKAG